MAVKRLLKKIWMFFNPTYCNSVRILAQIDDLRVYIARRSEELTGFIGWASDKANEAAEKIGQIINQVDKVINKIEYVSSKVESLVVETGKLPEQVDSISCQVGVLRQQFGDYLRPQSDRFTGHYEYWRAKRVTAIVEHYGESWFEGKRFLSWAADTVISATC